MNREDKHLSIEQIECVIETQPGAAENHALSGELEAARRHLEMCDRCQKLVSTHKDIDDNLRAIGETPAASGGPTCPSEEELRDLVGGLFPMEGATEVLEHITHCDHCGPILRQISADFATDSTPEEGPLLANLETAQPHRQLELARKLAAMQRPQNSRAKAFVSKPVPVRKAAAFSLGWTYAAASLLLAITAGVWIFLQLRTPSVDQLLAQAYSEQRTIEVRIDGAGYGPMHTQRGSGTSRFAKPSVLLQAEALIAANLSKYPEDPHWLQSKARSDLLEGNYRAAISVLQKALENHPKSTPLLKDLAVAHFLRAESESRPADYGNAIEYLGQVLAVSPDDPVALFNHAIASERLFLYSQAANDWEHYLKVDRSGLWSDEARKRQMELRKKIRSNDDGLRKPLLDPKQFVATLNGSAIQRNSLIDERVEEYLSSALSYWLPATFRTGGTPADDISVGYARRALHSLADYVANTRNDLWLRDLLSASGAKNFPRAISALNTAVRLNAAGKASEAAPPAETAAQLFLAARSPAGAIRARLEEIYALHHSANGKECLRKVKITRDLLGSKIYVWVRIQLLLEEGSCFGMMDDLERARQSIAEAVALIHSSDYRDLSLRVMLYAASIEQLEGRNASAWSLHESGLQSCWDGICPPLRAFQFYDELDYMSGEQKQFWLATAAAREAVHAVDATNNVAAAAMCHRQLAHVASDVAQYDEARREYEISKNLFAKLSQGRSKEIDELDGEIGLASLEVETGNAQLAVNRLQAVEARAKSLENYSILLNLYQTLGNAEKKLNNATEERRALNIAVATGELGLQSILSERDRLTWSKQFSGPYRSLVELDLVEQPDGKNGLSLWETYLAAPLRSRNQISENNPTKVELASLDAIYRNPAPVNLKKIAERIASLKSATVLTVVILSGRVAMWNYDNRGIDFRWLPISAHELQRTIKQFREDCSDSKSDSELMRRRARTLYDWLISPIAPRLDASRALIAELDGPLSDLPMQALMNASGSYLGDALRIVQSPGLLYEDARGNDGVISHLTQALVVGAPALTNNESNLGSSTDAGQEAAEVAKLFADAKLIIGKDATRDSLERNLSGAALFHFAGHALMSSQGTALVLASGSGNGAHLSIYNADDVHPARFHACRLAVLAACATAEAEEDGLSDPYNLVRAFLRAGVPHVVASRWEVDSAATSEFMRAFYHHLLAGESVSIGVQKAAVEIRSKPGMSHPYYWAAFATFGRM